MEKVMTSMRNNQRMIFMHGDGYIKVVGIVEKSSTEASSSSSSHSRPQHGESSSGAQQRKRARVADDDGDEDSAPTGAMAESLEHLRAIRASMAEMARAQAEMAQSQANMAQSQANMAQNQVSLIAAIEENTKTMTRFLGMFRSPPAGQPGKIGLVKKPIPDAGPSESSSSTKSNKSKKARREEEEENDGDK
ncbi:hypothetical protein BGX31_002793 [Mortierella sp. GBA43]|nr:hypothetical protein BGX31_002793 [Mortierella sp. GBA43]